MAKPYLVVVGNICAGKTTFVRRFTALYKNWHGLPEILNETVLRPLSEYDAAFHNAGFFIDYYANQHLYAGLISEPVIQESHLESNNLFQEAYHEIGYLSFEKFNTLKKRNSVFLEALPRPDFFIYLYAPLEILLARAEKRNELTRELSRVLIPVMQNKLENWIKNQIGPDLLFKIDTNRVNTIDGSSVFDEIQRFLKML